MKRILLLASFLLSFHLLYPQSKPIHPNFKSIAKGHKTLAILPVKVTYNVNQSQAYHLTSKKIEELEYSDGHLAQKLLYNNLLDSKKKYGFSVSIQDIAQTNSLLTENKISVTEIGSYSNEQLAGILGVDAIIRCNIVTKQTISSDAAIILGAVSSSHTINPNPTYTGYGNIALYDAKSYELLWNYDKSISKRTNSDSKSALAILNAIMKKISKKFPYNKLDK